MTRTPADTNKFGEITLHVAQGGGLTAGLQDVCIDRAFRQRGVTFRAIAFGLTGGVMAGRANDEGATGMIQGSGKRVSTLGQVGR